jgi:hypothetical protein
MITQYYILDGIVSLCVVLQDEIRETRAGTNLNHRWNVKSPHIPIHARGRQIGAKVPELHVPPPTKAPRSGEKMPGLLYLPLHVPLLAKAPQSGERVLDLLGLFLRVPTLPIAPRNGERVLQE